ncbi:MAG: hypothetical protein V1777_04015 [Candidatus Micrarchaeota archaeon]
MATNKKGNMPALLLTVAVVLVTVLVATAFFSPVYRPTEGGIADIRNEFGFSLEKGIVLGIDQLMRNGDSNVTDCWYCNKSLPPDVQEIQDSSEIFFHNQILVFLDELGRERDIRVENGWSAKLHLEGIETSPAINPQIHNVDFLKQNLPNQNAVVRVQNLFVKYSNGDTVKTVDLSGDYSLDYRIWYFYKKLAAWMNNDAGEFSQTSCNWLGFSPCQLSKTTCETPIGQDKLLITDGMIKSQFPLEFLVTEAAKKSVQRLNDSFAEDDSNISCTVSLVPPSKETWDYQRLQRCVSSVACQELRYCNMEGLSPEYACPVPLCSEEFDNGFASGIIPDKKCPNDISLVPSPRTEWIFGSDNSTSNPIQPNFDSALPALGDDILVACPSGQYKNENVTARPEITALFSVKCQDPKSRILKPESFGYLTNQLQLRIALKLNCDCTGQTGCGTLPGDTQRVFREIPCPDPTGNGCLGDGSGSSGDDDDAGDECSPSCSERSNNCYNYECVCPSGPGSCRCEATASACQASDYCYTRSCVKTSSPTETCPSDSISEPCYCKTTATPESQACASQNTPCTYHYCNASQSTCVSVPRCTATTACTQKVCENPGQPTEACTTQSLHSCMGSPDSDPCTEDALSCRVCSSSDQYCSDADRTAGWTCYPLHCSRTQYMGCVADATKPTGYRCIENPGGG